MTHRPFDLLRRLRTTIDDAMDAAGLPLLGLVLVACYAVDRKTWADAGLAHWLPLRWRLTVVATLSCVFGAAGT